MKSYLAIVIPLLLTLSGCISQLQDDRDICCPECEGSIVLQYRYIREKSDEFKTYVHKMDHYLFDSNGLFVMKVPSNPSSLQELHLPALKTGKYQVLTIGNMGASAALLPPLKEGVTKLSEVSLALTGADKETKHNIDELFWNTQEIEVSEATCESQIYICDMANIHCHLFISIEWKSTPPFDGDYTFRLSNVSEGYILDPSKSFSNKIMEGVEHRFPLFTPGTVVHETTAKLFNLKLNTEMITLRYFDNRLPVLQIFHGDKAVTLPLDLTKAFRDWSWRVNARPEQIYKIRATIFENGTIVLEPWVEGTVLDWVDGGTVETTN